MKNSAGWFCFVLLLGTVVGFSAGKWDVEAQTIDNKSTRYLVGTISYGTASDAFLLFDTQTHRLVAYTMGGNKQLELIAVRELSWDLKMVSWGRQKPTVADVREAYDRAQKKQRDKK